jgi:ATP-dependent Clp protease ATP-binding subunit ClpB
LHAQVRLQMQKDRISKMNEVKTAIEEMNKKIAMYEKPGNLLNNENETMYSTLIDAGQPNDKAMLNMVVNLKYSELPKLQSQYDLLEKKNDEDENMLFTETVGPDQIAEIVARWTGIPVTRLTQSEKDKVRRKKGRTACQCHQSCPTYHRLLSFLCDATPHYTTLHYTTLHYNRIS